MIKWATKLKSIAANYTNWNDLYANIWAAIESCVHFRMSEQVRNKSLNKNEIDQSGSENSKHQSNPLSASVNAGR